MCVTPMGDLKVNYDTPSIQDKKIATVKEKDMTSIMFKGNCTKSPNSASPCAGVMQLGEWKDTGTSLIQDQPPLLLKSTIKCNFGGSDIKITDCGQKAEPENIDVVGAPVAPTVVDLLKKFTVHLRRPTTYTGEFGFDWMRDEYIYPITSISGTNKELSLDILKLKTEYKTTNVSNPISPYNKEYYCSFLNIMLNQEVTLDIEIEEYEALINNSSEILFESTNPKLTITPSNILLNT